MAHIKMWSQNLGSCMPAEAEQITVSMRNEDLQFYGHVIYCVLYWATVMQNVLNFKKRYKKIYCFSIIWIWWKCWFWHVILTLWLHPSLSLIWKGTRTKPLGFICYYIFCSMQRLLKICVCFFLHYCWQILEEDQKKKSLLKVLANSKVLRSTPYYFIPMNMDAVIFFLVHPTYTSFVGIKWAKNRVRKLKCIERRTNILLDLVFSWDWK